MTGEPCLIPKDNDAFTLGEQIGTGSFAVVYKAQDKTTHSTIAIKSFRMKLKDRGQFVRAASEISFLKLVQHPNIIMYVCADIKKYYMYLGLEYSPHGSLINYMEKCYYLPQQVVQTVMKQLASALCYLHTKNIFHGDIKPENIIIIEEKPLKTKLTDFGLAEVMLKNHIVQKKVGSFFYMSPEMHLGFPIDLTSDVYSLGVVMYEMIYGDKPFPTKVSKEEYVGLIRKRVGIKYPQPDSGPLTPECLDLMKNLLNYEKQQRLMGVSLLSHPFLHTDLVNNNVNHYRRAYECFLTGVDLVKEKKYNVAYIELIEAVLHLQIQSTLSEDTGLYRYVTMKLGEFIKYSEKVLDRIINDASTESLELQSDTERLRCLLQSSPDLLAAYDLCVVGEMYFKQHEYERGANLVKDGLQVLISKMPHEPEGLRRKLLGTKMTQWMKILEGCGQGPSHSQK